MMGDGFQRCFEIGVAAVMHEWPFLYVDEIDNGLHHTVLEPVWRWLALLSQKRGLQIFATTHSEECIHAACRAFTALNDDGLRVLRLDRREDRTTAALYDRALVETAAETGMEIRG
jgi:ABC-type multidrug transport system ATPase subunit